MSSQDDNGGIAEIKTEMPKEINILEGLDAAIIPAIASGKWEEVLFKLTQDMDPWDIDLIELNKRFTAHVKEMKRLDLRIPAKILLIAAIIYRMKAETLNYVEEVVEPVPDENGHEHPLKGIKIPPLQLPLKREPKRRVSLVELLLALDKAMVIKDKREARKVLHIDLHGVVDGRDISEHIEELYDKIIAFLEKAHGETITFSSLLKNVMNRDLRVTSFASLLHLIRQEKVSAWQEKFFEEIYIKRLEEQKSEAGVAVEAPNATKA